MGSGAVSHRETYSYICSDSWIFILSGERRSINILTKAQISFVFKWVLAGNWKKIKKKTNLVFRDFSILKEEIKDHIPLYLYSVKGSSEDQMK